MDWYNILYDKQAVLPLQKINVPDINKIII